MYNIYGIGAALVDTEVVVSDEFLDKNQVAKGLMTLVEEERQFELVRAINSQDSHVKRSCGGSACNTVVAASSFGASAFYSAKVAGDEDGGFFVQDLNAAGVDFHRVSGGQGITGKCLVMVTPDAERSMNTFLGASLDLSMEEVDQNCLSQSEWLYMEGYLVTDEQRTDVGRQAMEMARDQGVKTSISLSDPFVVQVFADNLRKVIGTGVDLLFCNYDEALSFTNTESLEDAIEALTITAKTFVITQGAGGSVAYDGNKLFDSQGINTEAVDTNGAGDMFAGAFLYAITSGHDYGWASDFANAAAARVVSQFGPRIEAVEYDRLKQQFNI